MPGNSMGIEMDLGPLIKAIATAGEAIKAEAERRTQQAAREAAGRVQAAIPYGTRRTKGKHLRDTVAIDAPRALWCHVSVSGRRTRICTSSGPSRACGGATARVRGSCRRRT